MKAHLLMLIGFLAVAACSKTAAPRHFDEFTITYKKLNRQTVQRQIPIVSALVSSSTDYRIDIDHSQHPFRVHLLCFANFVSLGFPKPNANILKDIPPEDLDPLKVCINVNDQEGTDTSSPFKRGTYFVEISRAQPDRISSAFIYLDKYNSSYVPLNIRTMTGSLRLDAASDDAIVGEINVSDGDNSIAGTFNLKPTGLSIL